MLEILNCALSDDEHFFIKLIPLSCGHSVCQDCIADIQLYPKNDGY